LKYKCIAHISYEVIVESDSAEEAEQSVFELLADDVTQGTIRVDLFDNDEDKVDYRFPVLYSVEVENKK
jgi:hypothetical protein